MHAQVLRSLHIGHASLLDQAHSLKLEFPRKLPSLHDPPPAPSKHLTRCLRNRVQANELGRYSTRKVGQMLPTTLSFRRAPCCLAHFPPSAIHVAVRRPCELVHTRLALDAFRPLGIRHSGGSRPHCWLTNRIKAPTPINRASRTPTTSEITGCRLSVCLFDPVPFLRRAHYRRACTHKSRLSGNRWLMSA